MNSQIRQEEGAGGPACELVERLPPSEAASMTQMNAIHRKGQREKFKAAHEGELRQFYMARRKLEKLRTADGKLPLPAWKRELGQLQQEYKTLSAEYKALWDDMKKLLQVKVCVDTTLRQQERTQARRRDIER